MPRARKKIPTAGERLTRGLGKCRKAELIDLLVELAEDDGAVMRHLEAALDLDKPPVEVVASIRDAIADATHFDRRDINRNFDYDHAAYAAVVRYLEKLVEGGQVLAAMPLALELMERGSSQVEVSDEGMMTDEIEDGIRVVIGALQIEGACPPEEVVAWCVAMAGRDRVGFICDAELQELRGMFE